MIFIYDPSLRSCFTISKSFKTAISTENFVDFTNFSSKLPKFEAEASTSNYLSNLSANLAVNSLKTSSTGIISTNPPISTRERLKPNNLLANYIDPDLQFTLEGFEDVSMTKMKKNNGNKLPWMMNDERDTPSPLSTDNRKLSIDSMDDSMKNEHEKDENILSKKKGKKTRQRVKKLSVNFSIAGSNDHKEISTSKIPTAPATNQWDEKMMMTNGTSQMIAASVAKDRKEDYWYYDPISDGFYYENNGSRGWKKRNSKIHGPPPTTKKAENIEQLQKQQIQQQQQSQMMKSIPTTTTTSTTANVPMPATSSAVKYYDPASDGYFFEMASVDGWRRRQIQDKKQNGQLPPPMSSQHFPPLGTSPIIPSQTATPTPSPAGSYIPQSKILSHTQLEDLIVRHPSILTSISKNRNGQMFDNEPIPPSNSSTTSSVSDELTTPPPMNSSQNSVLMQHFKRLQLQQSNSSTTLNNGQTKTFSVGSSDEQYEFYWSDTEKPSSISSFDDTEGFGKAVGTRRPETLSFNPKDGRKPWWETSVVEQQQPRFDVEKFIADLPSFDEEKILRNLCVPPTPIGDKRRNTDDSTIFTPMKENSAWYNPYLVRTPVKPDKPAPIDVDKIWRTPCA